MDDFASRKSRTHREVESQPVKQDLRFYRTPQQEKEPEHVLQNKTVNQTSPGDNGSAKKVQKIPVIPETVTSL